MRKALAALFLAICLSALAYLRTDGFSEAKIYGEFAQGTTSAASVEVLGKLNQRYRYLARGRQCFVFESEDGNEVLKFLNYNRFYFPSWILHLPLPFSWHNSLQSWALSRKSRFQQTIQSLDLADRELSQETGIEYLHLRRGGSLPLVQLMGPGGKERRIDLNEVAFVLQRRADTPIFEKLDSIAKEQGFDALCQALAKVLSFLQKRCSLGIADDDRDIEINFGFAGDTPLLIDPGRLYLSEDLKSQEGALAEMEAATKKLKKWLSAHYPASAEWLILTYKSHCSGQETH